MKFNSLLKLTAISVNCMAKTFLHDHPTVMGINDLESSLATTTFSTTLQ